MPKFFASYPCPIINLKNRIQSMPQQKLEDVLLIMDGESEDANSFSYSLAFLVSKSYNCS